MRRAMVPDIRITQWTRERLTLLVRLLRDYPDAEVIEFLDQEIMRAAVVPAADMPPNVATPGARLIYRDLIADVPHEAVLVYPGFCHEIQIGRATSELQSLMRISYAVFCLKKKKALHQTN